MIIWLKLFFYIWAIVEMIVLTSLYIYASKEMKSKVIDGLTFLLAAFTLSICYRFIMAYTVKLNSSLHDTFMNGVVIVLLIIIASIRNFRKVSLEKNNVHKDIKKVSDLKE